MIIILYKLGNIIDQNEKKLVLGKIEIEENETPVTI